MTRYECKITPSVLRGVWVPGTFQVLAFVGGYVRMHRLLTVRTRRAVSAPCPFPCRTRSCTRWWSQWSAPGSSPARRRSSGQLGGGQNAGKGKRGEHPSIHWGQEVQMRSPLCVYCTLDIVPMSDFLFWVAFPSVWEADLDFSPDMMTEGRRRVERREGRRLKSRKKNLPFSIFLIFHQSFQDDQTVHLELYCLPLTRSP